MLSKSILKILLLSFDFEKFTSMNLWTDQSQHFKRSTVIGPSISLQRRISQSERTATKFSGITFIEFIITSVKYHLKLLSVKVLLSMITVQWTLYNYRLYNISKQSKIHKLQSALESGQEARIVQIDFSATFDRVNHQGIHYRLSSVGIGGSVLFVVTQFLSNRSQYVFLDGCRSKLVNVVSGVPQGSVFGPLLFLLYTSKKISILE